MTLERPWDIFFKRAIERLLDKKEILDIGGTLRFAGDRSNRVDPKNAWIGERVKERGISYKVLDYVDTYSPDIVGDIQDLPLPDNSQEAIVCMAVLEHIENPIKAAGELYRVLKPEGLLLVYVPFLYYYHAEEGYYGDFWRFTPDSLRSIFKPFASVELCAVRGPLETLIRLSPLGRYRMFEHVGFVLDRLFGKLSSKQVSGYHALLTK
jgi:SAM-dependent methyltransferase